MRKAILLSLLVCMPALAENSARSFDATYTATITNVPTEPGILSVWIPLPRNRSAQGITEVSIDSPYSWTRHTEKEFGNDYAFARIPTTQTGEITIRINFHGSRKAVAIDQIANVTPSRSEIKRALRADRMVTLSPRIEKLSNQITAGKTTTIDKAHAIYEYVMTTMKTRSLLAGATATPSAPATSKPATAPISIHSSCRWRARSPFQRAS